MIPTLKIMLDRVANWWMNRHTPNKEYYQYNLGMIAYDNDTGDYITFIIGYDNLKHDK